jgi:nitrogen fixation protein FixH
MLGYNLVATLGSGSLLAFALFFFFHRLLHWGGKISALATAALMLLIYVPLAITHWEGLDVFAIHFAFFMMIPYGMGIITGVHEERREIEGPDAVKKGMHWIPAFIIVFFMLIAVVDSIIISFATGGLGGGLAKLILPEGVSEDIGKNISSEFTGTVSNDLQDEEHQFNQYVKKLNKQRQRGWKVSGGWLKTPIVNQQATFVLNVADKSGKPISDADISVEFRRSSGMSYDKHYQLKETDNPGNYQVTLKLSLPGCWAMKVLVSKKLGGAEPQEHEIKGETEVGKLVDGKVVIPECIDGEPDVDEKMTR